MGKEHARVYFVPDDEEARRKSSNFISISTSSYIGDASWDIEGKDVRGFAIRTRAPAIVNSFDSGSTQVSVVAFRALLNVGFYSSSQSLVNPSMHDGYVRVISISNSMKAPPANKILTILSLGVVDDFLSGTALVETWHLMNGRGHTQLVFGFGHVLTKGTDTAAVDDLDSISVLTELYCVEVNEEG